MIHQLESDSKNEIRYITSVFKMLNKLIVNRIDFEIQKSFLEDNSNFLNNFKEVIKKITPSDVYILNNITTEMLSKINEFRCIFSTNISSIVRTDMVKNLSKYLSDTRYKLNNLINPNLVK